MRLAYYAIGGGLGHLVRARAVLQALELEADAVVLTASEHARDTRIVGSLDTVPVPAALAHDVAALRRWLLRELEQRAVDCLCVDAFPAGILGELCDLPEDVVARRWHVARLLRWPHYMRVIAGSAPRYEQVWRVEPLVPAQQRFLDAHSASCVDLALPIAHVAPADDARDAYWLVVHSGPRDEVAELLAYADEMRQAEGADVALWLATLQAPARLPERTRLLEGVVAAPAYFAAAGRIVSAAGFNVMREALPFRHKQRVLPMPRRYDDQFERARRAFAGVDAVAHAVPTAAAS